MNQQYQVGYKKPPKHAQWKPGQSGNPKGKKKATIHSPPSVPEILMALLNEPTTITVAGKKQMVPLTEVLLRKLLYNAVNGPPKLQVEVLKFLFEMGVLNSENLYSELQESVYDPFTEEHRRLLKITQDEINACDPED